MCYVTIAAFIFLFNYVPFKNKPYALVKLKALIIESCLKSIEIRDIFRAENRIINSDQGEVS